MDVVTWHAHKDHAQCVIAFVILFEGYASFPNQLVDDDRITDIKADAESY